MIKPLKIANKIFPTNLIQGPLAGYSCSAFRLLTWEQSKPAFTCTEMISCNALEHRPQASYRRYIEKDKAEGPVCFQLFGKDPIKMGLATKIVTDYGADLIDLNCGCPVKKVRKQGAGSSLLTNPTTLYQLLTAIKKNTHLPIAAKIRVEGNSPERFHPDLVKVLNDSGIDFVVVHGRHWTDTYNTPCNYEHIKFFVDELKIPVIGNGDIFCVDSLKKMLSTGCAGAMIGRAGIGQPWFIKQLIAQMDQQNFTPPSPKEIKNIFIRHIELLQKLLGSEKFALINARKFVGTYAQKLPNKKDFCMAINKCDNLAEFYDICEKYFS